jgi:hypothetical protein
MYSLEALFVDIDNFCQNFEPQWHQRLLTDGGKQRQRARSLCLSEVMTILVAFHQQQYHNFKHYYLEHVSVYWRGEFPQLTSYHLLPSSPTPPQNCIPRYTGFAVRVSHR